MSYKKRLFRCSLLFAAIIGFAGLLGFPRLFLDKTLAVNSIIIAEPAQEDFSSPAIVAIQNNSILPIASVPKQRVVRTMQVITTAYSSTVWETDDTPFITASGTIARDGIAANNLLPFGTKIRLPEIYGDKIFVIEDRMHSRKGYFHIDIWQPSYSEAREYGVKRTYIEILEN